MKRIIAAILLAVMLVSSIGVTSLATGQLLIAPNPNAKSDVFLKSFKTAHDPEDYLEFDIKNNVLTFSGMLRNEKIKYLSISFDGRTIYKAFRVYNGTRFSIDINLDEFKYNELEFGVYTVRDGSEEAISAFFGRDIVVTRRGSEWGFVLNKSIYESNVEYMSGWMYEKEKLTLETPERIRQAALNVTRGIEKDYDKAREIHEYVANSIYYDTDYANHNRPSTYVTAEEVFDKKIAVCEGYANLTIALLRAVGIPAVFIEGYALGVGNSAHSWDGVDLSSSNHAWVEAYVDGKWIIMDPTWDSKNTYKSGVKEHFETDFYRYFDVSQEMLSATHYVISRPNVFGKRGLASWAFDEAKQAYEYKLITPDCLGSMPDAINRLEFCDLVMNMLSVKLGKSVEKILADKKLTINYNVFTDTDYYNILAANALGIVNGKGEGKFDPEGTIKRQEAAAMLQRAAVNVLGVEKPNSEPVEFADANAFAAWGRDAINFVSASMDKNGRKVMGGKGEGKFAPDDLYTKQESVLTILRLYTAY